MLRADFEKGINRLTEYFKPRRWNEALAEEYYASMQLWHSRIYLKVVEKVILDCQSFPKIAEMQHIHRIIVSRAPDDGPEVCDMCNGGLISFLNPCGKYLYSEEKACSCDCSKGDKYHQGRRALARWTDVKEKYGISMFPKDGLAYTSEDFRDALALCEGRRAEKFQM